MKDNKTICDILQDYVDEQANSMFDCSKKDKCGLKFYVSVFFPTESYDFDTKKIVISIHHQNSYFSTVVACDRTISSVMQHLYNITM